MIVESMTYEEMAREYVRIYNKLWPTYFRKMNDTQGKYYRQYRRYLIKHRSATDIHFKPLVETLDSNSRFVGIPFTPGYKLFAMHGIGAKHFLVFNSNQGLTVIQTKGLNNDTVVIFTPHFFDRYVERFQHTETSRFETICNFMRRNNDMPMTPFPMNDYQYNMLGVTEELLFLGEAISDYTFVMKTCVTEDMLFKKEQKYKEALNDILKDIKMSHERMRKAMLKGDEATVRRMQYNSFATPLHQEFESLNKENESVD